jgi:hypothetical protein
MVRYKSDLKSDPLPPGMRGQDARTTWRYRARAGGSRTAPTIIDRVLTLQVCGDNFGQLDALFLRFFLPVGNWIIIVLTNN